MLLVWLVGAAFLYWPFKKWGATHKAPIISALLWPVMVIFFLGLIIWAKFFDKSDSLTTEKKQLSPQQAGKILAKKITAFTSTPDQKYALARQLLIHAKVDFKHEFYYPDRINPDLMQDIDFSVHSKKFLKFYKVQHAQELAELKQVKSLSCEPWDHSDRHLKQLNLIEITHIFNSMVDTFENPKEKFLAKLLIIDGML